MKPFDQLTEGGRNRRLRKLALAALGEYDLDVATLRFLGRHSNSLFRLTAVDGSRYVVRVGINGPVAHPASQVEAEAAWIEALARDTSITVPEPIRNRAGSPVTTVAIDGVPDERNVVVFRWLDGRISDTTVSPAAMRAIGTVAARLHLHAATWKPPQPFAALSHDRVFPYDEPVVLFDGDHGGLLSPSRTAIFREAADRATVAIDRLSAVEPMRVVHGDLHRWNVKIQRGIAAPFDFEDLLWGWPAQDIAITFYYQWSDARFRELNDAFRAGYETVAPWPERHPGEIDTFIASRTLVIANSVLLQPEWRGVAEEVFERGERRIRDLLDI
ncbi:MAG: phosphotransferase [Actinomycetota bacterium]